MCQSSYRGATGAVCNEGGDENDEDDGRSEEDTLHRSKREIVKLENFLEVVESKRGDLVFFNYFAIVGVVTSNGGRW